VEIDNGAADRPTLDKAPSGERYPDIAEGSSDIDKVATALSRVWRSMARRCWRR